MAVDPESEFYVLAHGSRNHEPHEIEFDALEVVMRSAELGGREITDEAARAQAQDVVDYNAMFERMRASEEPRRIPGRDPLPGVFGLIDR